MKLSFKTSLPLKSSAIRITETLNNLTGITADYELVHTPRPHYLVTLSTEDNLSHESVLEIGILIGLTESQ